MLEAALRVARDGELGEPPDPAPSGLRPFLQFQRFPAAALEAARRALDDDEFRRRVRASFGDAAIDEPARLLLDRPEGWRLRLADLEQELDARVEADTAAREERQAVRRLARTEQALAARQAEVEDLRAQLAAERAERRSLELRLVDGEEEMERLRVERARALQSLQDSERRLARRAEQVRDLTARLASAEAAVAAPAATVRPDSETSVVARPVAQDVIPGPLDGVGGSLEPIDRVAPPQVDLGSVREAVSAAATAADALARALEAAASSLPGTDLAAERGAGTADTVPPTRLPPAEMAPGQVSTGQVSTGQVSPGQVSPGQVSPGQVSPAVREDRQRPRRQPIRLSSGLVDDTAEAAEHLARMADMVLFVDGYNVSKTGWPDLELGLQRRRLVDALDAFGARTGAEVVVVFDGADEELTASASRTRSVRVRFSPAGVEADDVLLELVDQLPVSRPATVVTSDRRVRDGARRRGANVVASDAFLGALRH